MNFPATRMRRLRENKILQNMLTETKISIENLIFPLFIVPGKNIKNEIPSMPGIYHFSIDKVIDEIKEIIALGIKSVLLFGTPQKKDPLAKSAYDKDETIQMALTKIKENFKNNIFVITDVCLCAYTDHGHCGIIENNKIINDKTLDILSQMALSHVRAGSDMIAPSDMMDGRIQKIRQSLDESGFEYIPIMSYAAKFASSFYGPFRDAVSSAPQFGDRSSYQMNPANTKEAIREIELDINEGADIVMVKPALAYLDIINKAREKFLHPIAAYNVSAEYSMVKAAAKAGWIDEAKIVSEILTSIKRAGAQLIITYHAKDFAKL